MPPRWRTPSECAHGKPSADCHFAGATLEIDVPLGGVWIAAPAYYPEAGHLPHFARGIWQQIDLGANVNARTVLAVPGSKALCA